MKKVLFFLLISLNFHMLFAQAPKISPTKVSTAFYFDKTPPLKELIQQASKFDTVEGERNEDLKKPRLYPFFDSALPKGVDPAIQKEMGTNQNITKATIKNFSGISGYSNPMDNNGAVGPNHFMQSGNVKYAIFDKDGNTVVNETAMNTLFAGVPGSSANDGDPIIMYDAQADRWFAAEFSGVSNDPDYMLIAISETNDPTGNWYRWSFIMNGFPDYMKFGITEDSYLMGVNSSGDNIYAFERNVMINGGTNPQMVQFQNNNVPNSGFHVVMPMDTDGAFGPAGQPGQFITINDDAWNGGNDELWIYDLVVNWSNAAAATFQQVQTIQTPAFDSNFGSSWDNIVQPGTSQKLDGIPQVLMNRAQKRFFGTTESLVCVHTVDVDNTDHAGLRWYELNRNNGGNWSIRQSGTYAPDANSRWMPSIAQNAQHEIAIGYNVSSSSVYPSIRYCGQSSTEYANATGTMDYTEVSILEGTASQTSSNRWGDYANLSIDPTNDHTFWFATSYNLSGLQRGSKVAAWNFTTPAVQPAFSADYVTTCPTQSITLTDESTGSPDSWQWQITPSTFSYLGGTNANSQNPQVVFNAMGNYTVQLTVTNSSNGTSNTLEKINYITVQDIVANFSASPQSLSIGGTTDFVDLSICDPDSWSWSFPGGTPSSFVGMTPPTITYNTSGVYDVSLTVTKGGITQTELKPNYITVIDCNYCTPIYTNQTDDYINRVIIGSINNASIKGTNGYQDFTALSTDIEVGTTQAFSINITVNGAWTQYARAWIDWDLDCTFSDIDEAISLGSTPGTSGQYVIDGSFTIPANTPTGPRTLRISEHFNANPTPCENTTYGEAEDYTINIVAPLPVELHHFIGYPDEPGNQLEWATQTESNVSYFALEKSLDGLHFEQFGKVQAQGDSHQLQSYSFVDNQPSLFDYYRLKSVDWDGQFEYSDIITILRHVSNNKITNLYPNPVKDELNLIIQVTDAYQASCSILAQSGQVLQMRKIHLNEGTNKISYPVSLLPSGKYSLVVDGISSPIHFVKY